MKVSGLLYKNTLITDASAVLEAESSENSDTYATKYSSLVSSISSGNMEDTQKYLAQVKQYPAAQTSTDTPLGAFLASVSDSISRDDISEAQSALQTYQGYSSGSTTTPDVATTLSSDTSSQGSSLSGAVAENVFQLADALSSNNLDQAQTSYNSISSLISGGSSTNAQMQTVGQNLEIGNVSSAQMAFDEFLAGLSTGSFVSSKA